MESEIQQRFQQILESVIAGEHADMGNIQILLPASDEMIIIAQRGFKSDFLEHFQSVKAFDLSACGRALGIGSTITIDDVETDIGFAEHLDIARSAGYRSVKSVPIITEAKKPLGIISTHFTSTKNNWENDALTPVLPALIATIEAYLKTIAN